MNSLIHRMHIIAAVLIVHMLVHAAHAHPGPGIVCTSDGMIYFVIGPAHQLWKLDVEGTARPLITGSLDSDFRVPHHLVLDAHGNLYTASDAGSVIWKVGPEGGKVRVYPPNDVERYATVGLGGAPFTLVSNGDIIAIRERRHERLELVRINCRGEASLLAGGARGMRDGVSDNAQFTSLHNADFEWGPDDALYFVDDNRAIRRVTLEGVVTTIFDWTKTVTHSGRPEKPQIQEVIGLLIDETGQIYAADIRGRRIWCIAADGSTSIVAGTGVRGSADGPAHLATFDEPVGLALHPDGGLLVLEQTWDGEHFGARVRLIKDDHVTTLATVVAGSPAEPE